MSRWWKETYPTLFAAFSVLAVYASNEDQLPDSALVVPLVAAVGIALASIWIGRLVLRERLRARLLAVAIIVVFFGYGRAYLPLHDHFQTSWRGTTPNTSLAADLHLFLTPLALAILVLIQRGLRRTSASLEPADRFLRTMATILVFLPIVTLSSPQSDNPVDLSELSSRVQVAKFDGPDIYVLLFDGYPRADALNYSFGFDNRAFISELEDRGMVVASRSRSNYLWTFLSLSSMLNMRYLQDLAITPGHASNDRTIPFASIRSNRVVEIARKAGYRYVHLNSTWNGTSGSSQADVAISCSSIASNSFQALMIRTTWLAVLDVWLNRQLANCHLSNFQKVAEAGGMAGPKFLFAHFVLPHHPYLFDANGHILKDATVANQFEGPLWNESEQFIAQLQFVNKKILEILDAITENASADPVIVLISDHGIRPDVGDPEANLAVRFANLTAITEPGENLGLPKDITPVNLFRILFNRHLGTRFEVLPNRHFVSTWTRPYDYREWQPGLDSILAFHDRR